MAQLSLFDDSVPEALARQSDPVTSKAAAEEIRPSIGKLQAAFLAALKDLGGGPATAREVAERAKEMGLVREAESARKRSAELERMRLIVMTGVQRCTVTNKLAEGWQFAD